MLSHKIDAQFGVAVEKDVDKSTEKVDLASTTELVVNC